VGLFHAKLPEVPAPPRRSRPGQRRTRSARLCLVGLAATLAGATAGCASLIGSSSAAESPAGAIAPPAPLTIATAKVPDSGKKTSSKSKPKPKSGSSSGSSSTTSNGAAAVPSSLDSAKGSLVADISGAQMASWDQTATYCPETNGMLGNGTVAADSSGSVALTTSGRAGSCVGLISPAGYSSDVIEADIDFPALPGHSSTIANWTGFWLTNGAAWPEDGELDAVEVEPVDGQNAVTWHSGTSANEFSASTSGFSATRLPADGGNLTPGWHTVDIVYTKGYFAVYYDGQEFTSYTSDNVTGSPLNLYVTMANTPDTSAMTKLLGSPPMNSAPSPATYRVKDVKVWSYR
jgi:hypothetical protein